MRFSFTQARLYLVRVYARTRTPDLQSIPMYVAVKTPYDIRIFDICVRGYGASVCVSVVERGLLVRVPSPWGGLLGGRRWSSRERTVASRRSDRKRGVAVQHVTNVLFLGRERTPPCRNHASTHLFPP